MIDSQFAVLLVVVYLDGRSVLRAMERSALRAGGSSGVFERSQRSAGAALSGARIHRRAERLPRLPAASRRAGCENGFIHRIRDRRSLTEARLRRPSVSSVWLFTAIRHFRN